MPALIGLSPRLADQAFPRDDHELRDTAVALGNLSSLVENNAARILSTKFFLDLLADFNWERNGSLKSQIYTHLSLWFLGGKAVSVTIEIGDRHYKPHPIPENSRTALGIEECWADECRDCKGLSGRASLPRRRCARSQRLSEPEAL